MFNDTHDKNCRVKLEWCVLLEHFYNMLCQQTHSLLVEIYTDISPTGSDLTVYSEHAQSLA